MIVAATAALCLTASAAVFAQSAQAAASAPQSSGQSTFTTAPAPRAWSETTPQPPATSAPRSVRVTPVISDADQQTPPPAQAGTAPMVAPGRPMPSPRGQLLNVKVEFTITDQVGAKPPVKKTMTMVVADRESSRIRTNADYYVKTGNEMNRRQAPLSVDVNPTVEGTKIRLDFSIEYTVDGESPEGAPPSKTNVSERLAAVLESGVPMTVAQSSDAVSDRKVTIEIKATILK
jgi:hypothetical protein